MKILNRVINFLDRFMVDRLKVLARWAIKASYVLFLEWHGDLGLYLADKRILNVSKVIDCNGLSFLLRLTDWHRLKLVIEALLGDAIL